MKRLLNCLILLLLVCNFSHAQKINRKEVVSRHNVVLSKMDTLGSLTVGNGKFAFTVDATGLQSFPEYYSNGIPLGTESEWGWHSFPNKNNYQFSEALKEFNFNSDKKGLYAVQYKTGRAKEASNYFRENPHRLQLGNVGLEILKKDGSLAKPADIQNIHQELNLWTGEIHSQFTVEGELVNVFTCADATKDNIGVKVVSDLINQKRIKIKCRFPYPTNQFADVGTNYKSENLHQTSIEQNSNNVVFNRTLDNDKYYVALHSESKIVVNKIAAHYFTVLPNAKNEFSFTVAFSSQRNNAIFPDFTTTKMSSEKSWQNFWESGAAIDFAGSTDPRANELERRIILSEWLTRVQCAGSFPPQETGLTYNSWYGKPHMEMYWWHAAHFAFWNRTGILEKSMQWYFTAFDGAKEIAKRQGYDGVRWQKMTDNLGGESPSNVGSFLIWQQPHVIYLAELIYRNNPSKKILEQYKKLIFATADFMASFARYDQTHDRYVLGKGIIPAQECYNSAETFNSPYELAYWKWALQMAQKWRVDLGLEKDEKWQKVIDKISNLSQKDGVYSAAESVEDSYSPNSKFTIDHPAVLAALSTLPQNNFVDTAVMKKTFAIVEKAWHWEHTWGWDFPMVAMTATRLYEPEAAIDALFKEVETNTYLVNGHNYQDKRLTLYLPGNGGLLSAVAMMCAGFDGCTIQNPGFPKNGKWQVKWEGFNPFP